MSINFLNTLRPFEINSKIVEWDIRRAGPSIIQELGLLPQKDIDHLLLLPKKQCDVEIGKRQIHDKEFSVVLEKGFTDFMETFLEDNGIDRETDVIAVKKDACFVINKKVDFDTFGKVRFIPKNTYHAYLYIKPTLVSGSGLEFYFKRGDEIDVKGLVNDRRVREQILDLHKDGILNFLLYTVALAEQTSNDPNQMSEFLHKFVSLYKNRLLDFDYYREFNVESRYRYMFMGSEVMADTIDESMLEKVAIQYNYTHIILPLINLIV